MQENAGLQGLAQVLNLNYEYTYFYADDQKNMTADEKRMQKIGDSEFATLKYGKLIAAVDQDTDGIGQIFGLMIVYIYIFWPSLIKRGFLKRFATPLIRVYPTGAKASILEFYSLAEFKQWRSVQFGIDGAVEDSSDIPAGYRVKYYKGLATHSPAEVENMAQCFADNVYTYTWDDATAEYIEIMYGTDTGPRKVELRSPVTAEYDQTLFDKQIIKVSDQLQIETKTFQLEFMERKLPSAIDGMIPSQT